MKEIKQNENPFLKGKELIKTVATILIIISCKDNIELIDYTMPVLKMVVDNLVDWFSKKINNNETEN